MLARLEDRIMDEMLTTLPPIDRFNSYDFTLDEVKTIRWALLVLRAHWSKATVELSTEDIVALENRLLWPAE